MIDSALKTLNDSGFPLQVAVQFEVERTKPDHGWSVCYKEHAWDSPGDSKNGFIDLVLLNQHRTGYLAVECKRVRDSEWVFLNADGQGSKRGHAQVWLSHFKNQSAVSFGWIPVVADPFCIEAHFCAVRGQTTSERITLLERTAAELVLATERLAHEHRDFRRHTFSNTKLFASVIVTTANLKFARFNPEDIALQDGTLAAATFEEVPFVRFRKQLGVHSSSLTERHYDEGTDVAYLKESTVFIVNARFISEFLSNYYVRDSSLSAYLNAA